MRGRLLYASPRAVREPENRRDREAPPPGDAHFRRIKPGARSENRASNPVVPAQSDAPLPFVVASA